MTKYRIKTETVRMFTRHYPQHKQESETGWTFYPNPARNTEPIWFATYAAANLYKAIRQKEDELEKERTA